MKIRSITSEFPEFLNMLQNFVFTYNDDNKKFLSKIFSKISFLKNLSALQFHKLLYSITEMKVTDGEKILKEEDVINHMIIVKSGVLEVSILIDGNPFVLERLGPESVVNYRNIVFDQEIMLVNVTCVETGELLLLQKADIVKIADDNKRFERMFTNQFQALH